MQVRQLSNWNVLWVLMEKLDTEYTYRHRQASLILVLGLKVYSNRIVLFLYKTASRV